MNNAAGEDLTVQEQHVSGFPRLHFVGCDIIEKYALALRGIVGELGTIAAKKKISEGYRFRVKSRKIIKKLKVSDSVSVNGVCQTVTGKSKNEFEFVTMHETLKKTNLALRRATLTSRSKRKSKNALIKQIPPRGGFEIMTATF